MSALLGFLIGIPVGAVALAVAQVLIVGRGLPAPKPSFLKDAEGRIIGLYPNGYQGNLDEALRGARDYWDGRRIVRPAPPTGPPTCSAPSPPPVGRFR